MDRVRPGLPAGGEDLVDHQVALRGRRRADPDRKIGELDVGREAIYLAVDRDGLDPALLAGSHDANRDLSSVGNQDPADRANRR